MMLNKMNEQNSTMFKQMGNMLNKTEEPLVNEGCCCTGSYDGDAGDGSTVCDCDIRFNKSGFHDKKLDNCCDYTMDKHRPWDIIMNQPEPMH